MPPNNVIVKHVDRRLRGRNEKGQLVYSPDFTNTYYHPISSHIARKILCLVVPCRWIAHFMKD